MRAGDNPDTKLYGANVEWFQSKDNDEGRFDYDQRLWSVGLTAFKVYDADRDFSFNGTQGGGANAANRDGLVVYSIRAGGSFIPSFEDFKLYGEAARQTNGAGRNGGSVRANAWYVQPQYDFSTLPWTPSLTVRYAHFSGDGNPGDTTDRSWDPLFTDAGARGGNTWTQGLIYSQYVGANSNLDTLHAGLEVVPRKDELTLGAAYFRHDFDKPAQAGATSDHLMDELDVYAVWETPLPGLELAAGVAAGWPGAGGRQSVGLAEGDDRTIWLGQVVLNWSL
jgi:hypothetical protein